MASLLTDIDELVDWSFLPQATSAHSNLELQVSQQRTRALEEQVRTYKLESQLHQNKLQHCELVLQHERQRRIALEEKVKTLEQKLSEAQKRQPDALDALDEQQQSKRRRGGRQARPVPSHCPKCNKPLNNSYEIYNFKKSMCKACDKREHRHEQQAAASLASMADDYVSAATRRLITATAQKLLNHFYRFRKDTARADKPRRGFTAHGTLHGFGNCIVCDQPINDRLFELLACGHVVCGSTSMNRGLCGEYRSVAQHKRTCSAGPVLSAMRQLKLQGFYVREGNVYVYIPFNDFSPADVAMIKRELQAALEAFLRAHGAGGECHVSVELQEG
eukprot:m.436044 g.436044  ORF g.436044 m.436044 type:complete len:333 (+) comp20264_c0_seq26:275-1273(+)